jgi:anti-sigma factor ChrR (cupin superfamily)
VNGGEEPKHLRTLAQLWGHGASYDHFDWQPFRAGVDIYPLYGNRVQGSAAALLRYAPGARVPEHRHSDWEHILILSGTQVDDQGEYVAGSLVINRPGSTHAVLSPQGCVVLVIWMGPIEVLEPAR